MQRLPAWLVAAGLTWLPGAQAATWFDLYDPIQTDSFTIQVDLESLRLSGERPELLTRISYQQAQRGPMKDFRVVIAIIEVDCLNRQTFWRRASFYADTGDAARPLSNQRHSPQLAAPTGHWLPEKAKKIIRQSVCRKVEVAAISP